MTELFVTLHSTQSLVKPQRIFPQVILIENGTQDCILRIVFTDTSTLCPKNMELLLLALSRISDSV
jgi:hypothetical protein